MRFLLFPSSLGGKYRKWPFKEIFFKSYVSSVAVTSGVYQEPQAHKPLFEEFLAYRLYLYTAVIYTSSRYMWHKTQNKNEESTLRITSIIIFLAKLLHSDWLRAGQFIFHSYWHCSKNFKMRLRSQFSQAYYLTINNDFLYGIYTTNGIWKIQFKLYWPKGSNTNPKGLLIVTFSNSSGVVWTEKHLMCYFQRAGPFTLLYTRLRIARVLNTDMYLLVWCLFYTCIPSLIDFQQRCKNRLPHYLVQFLVQFIYLP